MNKLFLVCILLPLVAECISALDLCTELKCGTADSSDACSRLNCNPAPSNIATRIQNGTAPTSETTAPSKSTAPSNFGWPTYPSDNYHWGYPGMGDGYNYPFQMGYAAMDHGYGYGYQPEYQDDYQPYLYPYY